MPQVVGKRGALPANGAKKRNSAGCRWKVRSGSRLDQSGAFTKRAFVPVHRGNQM